MLSKLAYVFGVLFLAAGILGFVPAVAPEGMLFGILHVNDAHNIVHLVTGAIAIWAGYANGGYPRLFFQVFGVIYAVVAILGFWYGPEAIFELIANNYPDAVFHTIVAVISLYLGFMHEKETVSP